MRTTIILLAFTLGLFSCDNPPKNYVTLSGKITNPKFDTLYISKGKTFQKKILVNQDGSFEDTLKVPNGDYKFNYGSEYGVIYLKNNNVSSMMFDLKDFYNTLVYGGDDADINNFAIQNYLLINKHFSPDMAYDTTKESMDSIVQNFKEDYEILKSRFKNVDSTHLANTNTINNGAIKSAEFLYTSKLALQSSLPQGHPSPVFENYDNVDGSKTSHSDFQGKYVYMVFWATWHAASKKYVPFLKQLEQVYKDKNIAFVGVSLDDARTSGTMEKAKETWEKSVANDSLPGIQLITNDGWKSDFVVNYQIKAIPRFVLIDPNGNIVSPDAPSPSNPKLIQLLNSLGL